MRPAFKVKPAPIRLPLRPAVITASRAARQPFPAWISADDGAVALPAVAVTQRVRDALVLRTVRSKRPAPAEPSSGSHAAR